MHPHKDGELQLCEYSNEAFFILGFGRDSCQEERSGNGKKKSAAILEVCSLLVPLFSSPCTRGPFLG
jgi:hypothetical protein